MSVGFARAVEQGLRHNGVPVSFEPGWETRGNGQRFLDGKPRGLITHHTGVDYGAGLSILVRGRSDLPGPLCNACTYPDGRIHIIAAHVANHAGASGGRSMGPLPTTVSFNRLVWGNEVMFPGTKPWTAEQYRSARVLAGVICGILGHRDPEHCRSHYECSVTGKWDPGAGRGPGIPFDMNVFRREVWAALTQTGDDDMTPEQAAQLATVHREVTQRLPSRSAYAKPPWSDTVLGTSLNAEGRAHETLIEQRAFVASFPRVVREQLEAVLPPMIRDAVRAAIAEERK